MTFKDYVSTSHCSVRAFSAINRYGINEYTSHTSIISCGGIGRNTSEEIEQLQVDYSKTLDVAYQIVLENIRKGE